MLPSLPKHKLELIEEQDGRDEGFLRLRRQRLRVRYEDGTESGPFVYDAVDRVRLDAVVVVAHFRGAQGERRVYLRSCVRPPLLLRPEDARPIPEKDSLGHLWEVPAGLVEVHERSEQGLRECAARELHEEIGIAVDAGAVRWLGPSMFPAPGIIGERHFFFHCEVDALSRGVPPEDGSALEKHGTVADISLHEALALLKGGRIEDEKTEIALRRLAEIDSDG